MKQATANALFARLRQLNPHPRTELIYRTPFELLIAVMLSAQSTDRQVNLVTAELFAAANTPATLLQLGEARVKQLIQSIGLCNTKARHLIQTCQLLVSVHQGQIPEQRAALEALPGVGRKTANVVLNTAFHQPTIAVDTHIFRVANRTGLAHGKTPLAVERGLLAIVSPEYLLNAHHWLILHGRYVCTARQPHCASCVIRDLCTYPNKNT